MGCSDTGFDNTGFNNMAGIFNRDRSQLLEDMKMVYINLISFVGTRL
jgi:hypothetical protein